jgi:hypothetical protein
VVRLEKARAAEKELEKIMAVGGVSCLSAAADSSRLPRKRQQGGGYFLSVASSARERTDGWRQGRKTASGHGRRASHRAAPVLPSCPTPQDAAKAAALEDVQAQEDAKARANQLLADAEVAAAEKLLAAAQIEYDLAAGDRARASSAAFSDADRAESGKAAAAAVAGGLAAALPLALAASGGDGPGELLSLLDEVACCALFGVTYRWGDVVRWASGCCCSHGRALACCAPADGSRPQRPSGCRAACTRAPAARPAAAAAPPPLGLHGCAPGA